MHIPKQWRKKTSEYSILDMYPAEKHFVQRNEPQEVVAVLVLIVQAQGCGTWSGSSWAK
jgi:hypothetical protein